MLPKKSRLAWKGLAVCTSGVILGCGVWFLGIGSYTLDAVSYGFQPIWNLHHTVRDWAQSQQRLLEEHKILLQHCHQLEQKVILAESHVRKLQRMTTIREFSLPPPYGLVTVPVIALNSPQQHILIRGGVSEGLQKGQVVLHPDGHVVGRVEKVGNQWSRVVLVFHPSFHLPAVGKESHLHCIVTGNEENALLLHQEWPQPLQDQELVVTSDYGEVCPPHIPLGRWCAEKKLILPIVNPYTLDYVHVVRRLPPLPNFSKH